MTDTASLQGLMGACLEGYAAHHRLNPRQWQVCRPVLDCRTEAMGGLVLRCDHCAREEPYLSFLPRPSLSALSAARI